MAMSSGDVLAVIDLLTSSKIDAWLDGGWGVDALLGEETRPHKDVDIIIRVDDVPAMINLLGQHGFDLADGCPPSNFVLRDSQRREIDVHPVRFDEGGNGVYRMLNGEDWIYPAAGFAGVGHVANREVRCLTAEVQMLCHTGYEPSDKDFREMHLLRQRFGVQLPHEHQGDPRSVA
jgi:lincosamide nucleotidyltransferase A/C/D/E